MIRILLLVSILSGCSVASQLSEAIKEQRKKFQPYEGLDATEVTVESVIKKRIRDLRFCQKDNYGNVRLSKNDSVKVKPNEPTHISFKMLVGSSKQCNMSTVAIFPPSGQYHIMADVNLDKKNMAEIFFSGLSGTCNIYLTKDGNYFNQLPVPLSQVSCPVLQEQDPNKKLKGMIKAEDWINLNDVMKKKK